jgi:hypothetical protein
MIRALPMNPMFLFVRIKLFVYTPSGKFSAMINVEEAFAFILGNSLPNHYHTAA